MKDSLVSSRLMMKLIASFIFILLLAGVCYTMSSIYFSNKYFYETTQKLHANLADQLIEEKFGDQKPFDSTGSVNKALFGDIMHDMMAVNRAIELYLLDTDGRIVYSVVLDPDAPETKEQKVNLAPIKQFIAAPGKDYILGQDPRDANSKKVFSAAYFEDDNSKGYIYIILAGQEFLTTRSALAASYFMKLGLWSSLLTLIFAGLLGVSAIWYFTKNLRKIVYAAQRFKQGDLTYRIENTRDQDLSKVSETFNEMAETILGNIEKLNSVEKFRKELIANISHDLRTPLAIVQGYIETLQIKGDQISEKERESYLQIIKKSNERLTVLVSQLFEYSKFEANQIQPEKEPFLLSELANDIYAKYKLVAQKNGIEIELEMNEKIPLVFADISLVERAIQNLLDNALKFTPSGGTIYIQITLLNNEVQVAVKDTGPGIAKNKQALIFERYKQEKIGQEKMGAGLGLAIVKKILELHGSQINVFSKPNEGSTFSFSLALYSGN
ncbi:MAG: HAMP domain-containing sensor histidine kinase [Maribacter sp.]